MFSGLSSCWNQMERSEVKKPTCIRVISFIAGNAWGEKKCCGSEVVFLRCCD